MFGYFLQFLFLLLIYFFIFLFLFAYIFIQNKTHLKTEKKNFILLEKIYNNKIYYFKDFISDAPFILEWLGCFLYWKFFLAYLFVFVIFVCVKFIQFWIIIIIFPFYFLYFIFCLLIRKEIKYNYYIKANTSFLDLILLLLWFIPIAYLFNKHYQFFKIILNKSHTKKNVKLFFFSWLKFFFYTSIYRTLLGLPLWNLYLINSLTGEIIKTDQIIMENTFFNEKPFFVRIKEVLIGSHQKSYIYEAWRSKIYYKNNALYFNPNNKAMQILAVNEKFDPTLRIVITKIFNDKGEIKIFYHTSCDIPTEEFLHKKFNSNMYSGAIMTHNPLKDQKTIFHLKNLEYKNNLNIITRAKTIEQHVVCNNISQIQATQYGHTKNFIVNPNEIKQLRDQVVLNRLIGKDGIFIQYERENKLMFSGMSYSNGMQNLGHLKKNKNLILVGEEFSVMQKDALNQADLSIILKLNNKIAYFYQKEKLYQKGELIILEKDPFILSGAKNPIYGSLENIQNRTSLHLLQCDKNISQKELDDFVFSINKNMIEKYDYDDFFRNNTDFKNF